MGQEITEVTKDNVSAIMEELNEAFYGIPFENSDFQTEAFVVAAQQTPARAYRAVGLRMFSKLQAVKHNIIMRKRADIDIAEKRHMMDQEDCSTFDRQRYELDILELEDGRSHQDKLMSDAIHELNTLYAIFKSLPKYTREAFEAEEHAHFDLRLKRQLRAGGAQESLLNMTEDLPALEARIQEVLNSPAVRLLDVG